MPLEDNPAPTPDVGHVDVSVPLHAQYAATVRTVAASLGADAGFTVDELDDIRLALSEVFSALADDADPDARATVAFSVGPSSLRIDVSTNADELSVDLDELALGILRSVTDDFEVTPASVVLMKQATEATAVSATS